MQIRFNGEWIQSENNQLLFLLEKHELSNRTGIAVAINLEVIPRNEWPETALLENDEILIITAAAGG